MTAADESRALVHEVPDAPDLMIRLDTSLPATVRNDRGTALFVQGACFHRHQDLRELELLVDGRVQPTTTWGMPRRSLFTMLRGEAHRGDDPEGRSFRSGFWSAIALEPDPGRSAVELSLRVRAADGRVSVVALGAIPGVDPSPGTAVGSDPDLVAICMATFDPDPELFRAQIESIRAQTYTHWVCLISDDASGEESFAEIKRAIGDDQRFVVARTENNVGYYRNFDAALAMAPPEAGLVALCDQDDRWHPDKLSRLREALGDAQLVYSDQRLVDAGGRVRRETMWKGRRNNHANLASLLVANTVTGAASLFRREVAELARPFPDPPGFQFHDHWIALVALTTGVIAYVDRPLYDYVQHGEAVVGQVAGPGAEGGNTILGRLGAWLRGARPAYFYGYVPAQVHALALLARFTDRIEPRKRAILQRFVSAERRPGAFLWLALRPLRVLVGATETLGVEAELSRGIAWRCAARWITRRRRLSGHIRVEAECPPLTAAGLGQRRIARWRRG